MKSMFNERDLQTIQDRIHRLTPEATPRWGSFSVDKMLCHLIDAMTVAMEGGVAPELQTGPPLFVRHLARLYLPFPKGVPTVSQMLATDPVTFAGDRERVLRLTDRFAATRQTDWAFHPFFGHLDGPAWGKLTWRHIDHHLGQFGI